MRRFSQQIRVQCSAESLVRTNDQYQLFLQRANREERMKSWISPVLPGNKNLIHQSRVTASGEGMLLRFAHLRRSHHLHRLGDLRGVADRFDPAPYVLGVRHLNVSFDYRQPVLNSSSAAFICASRSLSISFFSRIVWSKLALRVCRES